MTKYIKSPLNYTGGKYKLLSQILPLFPKDINTFVDLFCGGANVSLNVNAKKIICNDINKPVIDFCNEVQKLNSQQALNILKKTINKYNLSKTNEEGFKNIRNDYNNGNREWYMFYAMLTHAFNYQIRFNKNGEYNMPFGRNRSSFNPSLEKKFIEFIDRINSLNIVFTNRDFRKLDIKKLNKGDFVYADPPYLISTASYNENGGWTTKDEKDLYSLLDNLNQHGIRFALSNVIEHKGLKNKMLIDWAKNYKIFNIKSNYNNSNYQKNKKQQQGETVEVLIINY